MIPIAQAPKRVNGVVKFEAPSALVSPGGTIRCERPECLAEFEIAPGTDPSHAARTAAAMGWVVGGDHLFCGSGCAKRAPNDEAAGSRLRTDYAAGLASLSGGL